MSISNYAQESLRLANELRESLTPAEVQAIHTALKGQTVGSWLMWRDHNSQLVAEYVRATPSQRLKRKFQEHRLYITMAAIQLCLEAHALLNVLSESYLTPGGSYRNMSAHAGLAYAKIDEHEIPYWPFEQLSSPFSDDPL